MPGTNVDPVTVAGASENQYNEAMARYYNIKEHKSDLLMAEMLQWPKCSAQSFDQNTGNPATAAQASQASAATATASAAPRSPGQVEASSPIGGGPGDIQQSGTGGVAIQSAQTVQFTNKGPFNGKWIIQQVRIDLSGGKLQTSVNFRKCLKPSDYPTLFGQGGSVAES